MSSEGEVRKLTDLRVVDLRVELEKRGLEKAGVKASLIERLAKALKDEGKDPDIYEFEKPKRNSSTKAGSESDVSVVAEELEKIDDFPKETQNEKEMDDSKGNGHDNEDSLNITIEEDEDQLLTDDLTDDIDEPQRSMERDDMKNVPTTVEDEPHEEASSETAEKLIEPMDEKEETGSGVGGETEAASTDLKADTSGGNSSKTTSVAEKPESSTTTPASAPTSRSQPPTEPNSGSSQNAAKPDKDTMVNSSAASRSLWVAGLATITRATDLKQLLSKYGKVVGAKVVTNARMPSARCYGYVVMATVEDAEKCIKYAHRTELHGRFIIIDKARSDKNDKATKEKEKKEIELQKSSEKSNNVSDTSSKSKAEDVNKTNMSVKSDCNKSISGDKKNNSPSKDSSVKRDEKKSLSRDRSRRTSKGSTRARARLRDERLSSRERFRRRSVSRSGKEVLSLKQIIEERDRQRLRERERALREVEQRRRREEQARSRELDRRHKEESKRLERERERLRIERERLQREKADLIRLERKRLEQELFELQQRKLEVVRRVQKRALPDTKDSFPVNRKRMNVSASNRYDVPPPAQHYEMPSRSNQPSESLSSKKHEMYKREEYKLREEYKPREMDIRNRDLRGGPREEYKMRDEYSKSREEVRGRDDIRGRDDPRSRDEYSKHDRPDFPPPPPPPRISGPNMPSKYNSPDSPYTSSNRPSRDMMRREPMPPGAMSSVRNNYSDGSGGPGDARNSPPTGPYRPGQDERDSRRPDPDHRPNKNDLRSSHDNRYSDIPSLKDYPDRDAGVWINSTVMKSYGSMSGPGGGSSSGIRDPWIKNEPPQMGGSGQWGNSNARLESSDRWMSTSSSRMLSGPPGVGSYGGAGSSNLLPPGVTSSSYMSDQRYDSHKSSAHRRVLQIRY